MLNFQLKELLLVSTAERRARQIRFHPKATVFRGANDTGKSSILKSIFHALGAEAPTISPRWKAASVSYLLTFSINSDSYSVYRQGKSFSIFGGATHLGTFSGVTKELAPYIARLFNFKLVLSEKDGTSRIPPPAFLFLPFYLDQDDGWSKNWSSFANLSQFKDWKRDVINYHSGIRPNEWYALKVRQRETEVSAEEPLQREKILVNILHRLEERLSRADFDIDVSAYKKEIDRLLLRCEEIKKKEQAYKAKLVDLDTERIRLEAQRDIVTHARQELDADYEYSAHVSEDHIDCPLCGATYSNSFAERFSIAQDQDRCLSLLQEIQEKLRGVNMEIERHKDSLSLTNKEMEEVAAILNEKKGKVTLQQLIENEGKREVANVLTTDLENVKTQIGDLQAKLREIQEGLKQFEDRKRTSSILSLYKQHLQLYLHKLNVSQPQEKWFKSITANIKDVGSDQPRAILAYYLAFLNLIRSHGHFSNFPLVIDAPNQQEQDDSNIRRMLEAIHRERPEESQLIIGLVNDYNIDFEGDVVEMSEENHALCHEEYDEVFTKIRPYAEANLQAK